jgi:3-phosphoshikimate 1-carboxyvinyltransferase
MEIFKIKVPISKSYAQREIAASLISKHSSTISLPGISEISDLADDIISSINAAKTIGADVELKKNKLFIQPNRYPPQEIVNVGESGLALNLFSFIAPLINEKVTISGENTLLKRKQSTLFKTLKQFGFEVNAPNYPYLPFIITKDKTRDFAERLKYDGSKTSQALSGALYGFAYIGKPAKIIAEKLTSEHYVEMTASILGIRGLTISISNFEQYKIYSYKDIERECFYVEGCWSSASFWFVLGLVRGNIKIEGLDSFSKQADRQILSPIYRASGLDYSDKKTFQVKKSELKAFSYDISQCPDLAPNLSVLALFCDGVSKISGIKRLRNKESNRAEDFVNELKKIGADIDIEDDSFIIKPSKLHDSSELNSHSDHRVIMALELAAICADINIQIDYTKAISKSYPCFYKDLDNYKKHLNIQ